MINLLPAGIAAARDPLVVALAMFSLGGLLAHLLFRRHPVGRAVFRVVFLVILTVVLFRAGVVPYEPLTLTGSAVADTVRGVLKIAWWLWAAWFLVAVVRVLVITNDRPHEGKLIQDLIAGVIYLSAALAIVAYVFDLPIKGLLATSGVIAIILGLALQSTLSDVFSGIVLNFSRPYRPGDWITVDGSTEGRVIEINWRATHILTIKRDLAILPNSTIAKAKIVNISSPSGIHGMTVSVQLDGRTSPATGSEVLRHAILNTQLVLATPAPSVAIKSIAADAITFELSVFIGDLAHATRAQNELFEQISRHLAATAICLKSTESQLGWQRSAISELVGSPAERAIGLVAIFGALTDAERKALAAKTRRKHYEAGETLVRPGDVLDALSVVAAGVVSIRRVMSGRDVEVLRMGPGDHFGEIGLLTGTGALSSLTALTPVVIHQLAKEDLAPVLESRLEISQELCRVLALRQAAGQLIANAEIEKSAPPSRVAAWFSDRLHGWFNLANAE